MIGFCALATRVQLARKSVLMHLAYVFGCISLMSAPAANAFSLPVITIAPIESSASYRSSASLISATSPLHSAFSAFGRFSVIRATFFFSPVSSALMNSYALGAALL
uniref:Uncharacterized protein n=1 Tax=Anopheles darlingi TaxID=43151 RepID=A0A2M4DGC9_ANODA